MSIIIGALIFIFPFIFGYIVGYVYGKGYEDRKWNKTSKRDRSHSQAPKEFIDYLKKDGYEEDFEKESIFKEGQWEIYMYKPYNKPLEDLLKQALEDEDFEKAAELRDKIKKRNNEKGNQENL